MESCTRPSYPGYVRNSLLGQAEQYQPPVSSSLLSGGFHPTGDNTNSHFQVAEVNGSAGKWSTSKPGRVKHSSREHSAGRRWELWTRGVNWAVEVGPPWILEAPGLCQAMWFYFSWKPKCQLSAVLTSILHATSALRYLQWSFSWIIFPLGTKLTFPRCQQNVFQTQDM